MDARFRKIFDAAVGNISLRAISMLATLVVTPLVLRNVGVHNYGVFSVFIGISTLFVFLDLGIGNSLISKMAAARQDSPRRAAALITHAVSIIMASGICVSAVIYTFPHLIPWAFFGKLTLVNTQDLEAIFKFFGVFVAIGLFGAFSQQLYQSLFQPIKGAVWSFLSTSASTVGLYVSSFQKHALVWMMFSQLAIPGIVGICGFIVFLFTNGDLLPRIQHFTLDGVTAIISTSRSFLTLQVAVVISWQIDSLIVNRFLGSDQVAVYSTTLRLFIIPTAIFAVLISPLWPAISDAESKNESDWSRKALFLTLKMAIIGSIPLCIGGILFGQDLIRIWTGGLINPPVNLILASSISLVLFAVSQPLSMYINAMDLTRMIILTAGFGGIANVSCSILLTRIFRTPAGPIWGSIISQFFFFVIPVCFYVWRTMNRDAKVGERIVDSSNFEQFDGLEA
jgi:O-antigen/teichoic acid export membrane protein